MSDRTICIKCKKEPRRNGHNWCKRCYNTYRRERYAAGHPSELKRSRQGIAYQKPRRTRGATRVEAPGEAAARMRKWRSENPLKARAARIADKHRRRGARCDKAHIEILLSDPCAYCGGSSDTVDHIRPVIAGGDGEWENLTASCRSCNSSKNATPMLHFLLNERG